MYFLINHSYKLLVYYCYAMVYWCCNGFVDQHWIRYIFFVVIRVAKRNKNIFSQKVVDERTRTVIRLEKAVTQPYVSEVKKLHKRGFSIFIS